MKPSFSIIIFAVLTVGTAVVLILGSWLVTMLVGPHRRRKGKLAPYECGCPEIGPTRGNFNVKFFIVALLFLMLDVELSFLLPWATVYKALGGAGLLAMGVFLAILILPVVIAWSKGALEWTENRFTPPRDYAESGDPDTP